MAKNIERILNKLQGLCDEKELECASDFAQHQNWLLETFKMNALQKLGRPKVELACPTSAKKQKTGDAPMESAPVDVKPTAMQTDSVEEPAPMKVRFSPRTVLPRASVAADTDIVLQSEPASVAAPDPDAAVKLAAAMAAAMGNDKASEASEGHTLPETAKSEPTEVQPTATAAATRTPVAATKPGKNALISPDSPREKKSSASACTNHSQPKPQPNPVQATTERQTAPTPHRTLSATEQLSRLRQRLAGIKGQTPSQSTNPGASRLYSADKSASTAPASVTSPTVNTAATMNDVASMLSGVSTAPESCEAVSTSDADTQMERQQQQEMARDDDTSQKRDVDQVEHTDSVPKKTKLGGSLQSSTNIAASPAPTTAVVQPVDTNNGAATQVDRHCTESGQQKKPAAGTVEDQLAMAAARRQQMELDQAAERTKENEPVVSGSSPSTDQSKKRCVTAAVYTVTSSIVAELSCCCFLSCADRIRMIWMPDRSALKHQRPMPRTCPLALTRC